VSPGSGLALLHFVYLATINNRPNQYFLEVWFANHKVFGLWILVFQSVSEKLNLCLSTSLKINSESVLAQFRL